MCELCLPRRAVLAGAAGVALAGRSGWRPAAAAARVQAAAPPIVPRAEWGPDLAATGPVPEEPDIRFLLVHHSVNANDYSAEQVVGLLTGIYRFHTSPEKGWPDIAYNFLVDRFGTIYEGRTGSLDGPRAGDATGGSQGFAQLCCFIGDHSQAPPSVASVAAMTGLLAFLGDRHGLDLSPGASTSFVSRGSNRHPPGVEVRTLTISGHRDMSATACPGSMAYAMVEDGTFARLATERRGGGTAAQPQPPSPPETTTSAAAAAPPPTTTTTTALPPPPPPPPAAASAAPARRKPSGGEGDDAGLVVPTTVAASAAAVAAVIAFRARRRSP